jgi:general secretion pathway protein G
MGRTRGRENVIERGFTLVELLIVIVILGILAGIVVFAVGNLTSNAKTNACATEKSTIVTADEAYKANNGSFAADMATLVAASNLKTTPADYTVDNAGNVTAIANNAGGCT